MSDLYELETKPRPDSDKITFLNLRLKPGKVDYVRAGYILDWPPAAIRKLVTMGYLKPLGRNGKTEHKYFLTKTIVQKSNDEDWMHQAACALQDHWSEKNSHRQSASNEENRRRSPRSFPLEKKGNGRSLRPLATKSK